MLSAIRVLLHQKTLERMSVRFVAGNDLEQHFWLTFTGDVAGIATAGPPGMHGRFGGCG